MSFLRMQESHFEAQPKGDSPSEMPAYAGMTAEVKLRSLIY